MELYISALLSLLVLLLLIGVFYLYKQVNSLLVKVNKITYDINNLQDNNEKDDMFGNMDMMNNFMNSFSKDEEQELEQNGDEELDEDEELDGDDDEELDDEELDDDDDEELDDDNDEELDDDDDEELDDDDEELDEDEELDDDEDEEPVKLEVKPIIKDLKSSGKTLPSEPAKSFDVGYTTVSDNDGLTYEVMSTKTGVKKWRKLK